MLATKKTKQEILKSIAPYLYANPENLREKLAKLGVIPSYRPFSAINADLHLTTRDNVE